MNTCSIISQVVSKMHVSGAEYMDEMNLSGEKRNCRWKLSWFFSCYSTRGQNCPTTSLNVSAAQEHKNVYQLGNYVDQRVNNFEWTSQLMWLSLFQRNKTQSSIPREKEHSQGQVQGLLEMPGGCPLACSLRYRYSMATGNWFSGNSFDNK